MTVLRDFGKTIRDNYLATITISLIALTIFTVYWQDFAVLANEASRNEAMSHLILIPVLIFYIVYRKKEMLKASILFQNFSTKVQYISMSEIVGLSLCLSAFLLYWYGSYTFYALEYHLASLIIFVVGVIVVLFNFKALVTLIPAVSFLVFLLPPPSNFTFSAGALLGNFNAQASYTLLKTIGIPVTLSYEYGPPILAISNPPTSYLEFAVDLPCSGIYSLVAFTTFAAFLAYILNGSIIKKAILFPLGFIVLPILNVLRISLIISIAYWIGEEIAMTIFHAFSGWILIFFGILLLLLVADRFLHLKLFKARNGDFLCLECGGSYKRREYFCKSCGRLLKVPQLKFDNRFWTKIIALLLASYLVTLSIQAPIFAFAQGLTITNSDPTTETTIFPKIENHKLKFLFRDVNFEELSKQDASLLYAYLPENLSTPTVYVLVGVDSSISILHNWEVCLVTWQTSRGYPPLVNVFDSKDVQVMQNPPIIARYFTFSHPANYTQVTLYWYQKALFKTGVTVESKYVRTSLIILTWNSEDIPKLEEKLLMFGKSITAHWKPLKAQSLISLGIPTMQILLSSTILFALMVQITQYTREWRRKATNLKIFGKFAPRREKLLFRTIKELIGETRETTTENVASAFEKATGETVKPDELIDLLNNLQKHKIINSDIINIRNQPRLVWKP